MFASFEATKDPKADEAFENLCQLCRAQNIEFTPELAIVARPRAPRVLVARRSSKARESSPEHLHLDRRQLGRCPVLEEEGMLRLLNYQNNAIARIEHLDGLPHLAFLDLYDNRIQNIENLDGCRNLRVLMLGKNQIMRIEKLNALEKLDVLDLHSNRIREVQNISHLKHLRVLNLAGNLLQQISGLDGLAALMELNIRRNAIASTFGLEKVPQLQRVFASHNHIVTHEGLRALGSIPNLRELSLDGNPVVESAEAQVYRAHILSLCPTLETLDNVKADLQRGMLAKRKDAEEQRHLDTHSVPRPKSPVGDVNSAAKAPVGIRSFVISPCPAAPQVEASSSPSQDMQRPLVARSSKTISGYQTPHPPARTAQCQSWLGDSLNVSAAPGRTTDPAKDVKASMTSDEVLQAIKAQWQEVLCGHALMTRHGYVKREHAKELSIFGRGLDALEKVEYQSTVTNIHFHYILVGALANEMVRLTKFKDLNSITFVHNQIQSPKELEPFRKLTRLRNVAIKDNPLCSGRASFRVSILRWLPQLRKIDGHDIEDFERVEASNLRASLPSPAATSRENTEDGSCEAIDMMMKRACQVDHQISMAHLHFDDVVRDAIREVWLDLHSERVGVTATTGAGSRMTNLTAAAPAFCDHGPVLDD